jgi:nucleotidyltransferase/DNA polymerase involved in DNA repair
MTTPIAQKTQARAIIQITARGEKTSHINYSRRMYAIIRRYTPEAVEVAPNECFAELTGLRTFFKMSYAELAQSILKDLKKEIGASFVVHIAKAVEFEAVRKASKKAKQISTYKEINSLFKGASFVPSEDRASIHHTLRARKIKLSIPYLGKVG